MSNKNHIWKPTLHIATNATWTKILSPTKGWRPFLKVHNRSDQNLKIAIENETPDLTYIDVGPGGFWEFADADSVPRNGFWVKAHDDELDIEVVVITAEV